MDDNINVNASGNLNINEIYSKNKFNLSGAFLCVILLIVFTLLILFIPTKPIEKIISYALAPIVSFLATIILHYRYKQVCSATDLLDNQEFIINKEYIIRKCTYSELKIQWNFIRFILYDDNYYYIFLEKEYIKAGKLSPKILVYTKNIKVKNIAVNNTPIKIPKRFFKSTKDIDTFNKLCGEFLDRRFFKTQGVFKYLV